MQNIEYFPIIIEKKELATDFISIVKALASSFNQKELALESLKQIKKHDFFKWLNNQPAFKDAKQTLISRQLIIENLEVTQGPNDIWAHLILEYSCASIISTLSTPNYINSVISSKKIASARRLAERLKNKLFEIDGIVFACPEKQQFLQMLLDDLLSTDEETVFNSDITHQKLFRELFGKTLIRELGHFFYNEKSLIPSFYADLVVKIVPIFFVTEWENLDKSDWIAQAIKIIASINDSREFLCTIPHEQLQKYAAKKLQKTS